MRTWQRFARSSSCREPTFLRRSSSLLRQRDGVKGLALLALDLDRAGLLPGRVALALLTALVARADDRRRPSLPVHVHADELPLLVAHDHRLNPCERSPAPIRTLCSR